MPVDDLTRPRFLISNRRTPRSWFEYQNGAARHSPDECRLFDRSESRTLCAARESAWLSSHRARATSWSIFRRLTHSGKNCRRRDYLGVGYCLRGDVGVTCCGRLRPRRVVVARYRSHNLSLSVGAQLHRVVSGLRAQEDGAVVGDYAFAFFCRFPDREERSAPERSTEITPGCSAKSAGVHHGGTEANSAS